MAALRLELRAREGVCFTVSPTRLLHAALHRALEQVNPTLGARVHDTAIKPLALSPLSFADHRGYAVRVVAPGKHVHALLTVLGRDTLDGLLATLTWHWREAQPLALDWHPFTVESIAPFNPLVPGAPPLVTYAQLLDAAPAAHEVTLRFVSPVIFRNKGQNLPPDDPWRVFQSYLRRWEAFSDVPVEGVTEAAVREAVRLRIVDRLDRWQFNLGMVEQPGFLGAVQCAITGDEALRRSICALADYALYCGTGARTAFGMGRTERDYLP
jgi:CRISPR-associated endoribonuclease Cas6